MKEESPFRWLWQELASRFGERVALELKQGFSARSRAVLKEKRAERRALNPRARTLRDFYSVPEGFLLCLTYEQVLPTDDFHRDRTKKHGRSYRCRDCTSLVKRGHLPKYRRPRGTVKEERPKKERAVKEKAPKPMSKKERYKLITVQDAESMSLEEWSALPLAVQKRITEEYAP